MRQPAYFEGDLDALAHRRERIKLTMTVLARMT
jgi:hypothetical protein